MSSTCNVLKTYIDSKKGDVTYGECLYFLNNKTLLTQIEIGQCLLNHFPVQSRKVCHKWVGVS